MMTDIKSRVPLLLLFLVVVLGVGFTIGWVIRPGEWYMALSKPFFTPPGWLFAPVWTIVYILIAIAGWRVVLSEGASSRTFGLWCVQMMLNWLWTPVFFGIHQIGFGLAVILALLASVIAFILTAQDRVAKWCFVPYAVWLCYASSLNGAIFFLN
jgi:benzodiazapine receptor